MRTIRTLTATTAIIIATVTAASALSSSQLAYGKRLDTCFAAAGKNDVCWATPIDGRVLPYCSATTAENRSVMAECEKEARAGGQAKRLSYGGDVTKEEPKRLDDE